MNEYNYPIYVTVNGVAYNMWVSDDGFVNIGEKEPFGDFISVGRGKLLDDGTIECGANLPEGVYAALEARWKPLEFRYSPNPELDISDDLYSSLIESVNHNLKYPHQVFTVSVGSLRGEARGYWYRRNRDGGWQILMNSYLVPDVLHNALADAFEKGYESLSYTATLASKTCSARS